MLDIAKIHHSWAIILRYFHNANHDIYICGTKNVMI